MESTPIRPERSGLPAKLLRFVVNALRYSAGEIQSIAPALLFFLVGFLVVLLVIKLFLAQYAIGFSPFSEAVIGAIFAAKAVLVLDHRDYARLRHFPRVYAVVCKTIIYVFAVLVFGVVERVIHGYRETGSLGAGIRFFFHRTNRDRFFGTLLCVAIVFGAYFVIREVERMTGKGSMYELFFRRPARVNKSAFGAPANKSAVG
ncbi:MAG TPA: hypothetical protein VJX23_12600 [Candidatus Binataceae bacterium]|nr:hypothetical protein [Candidatus Binataceae bacterium]